MPLRFAAVVSPIRAHSLLGSTGIVSFCRQGALGIAAAASDDADVVAPQADVAAPPRCPPR